MKSNEKLFSLIRELEAAKIFYTLARHDDESIMIQATVPGERWEIQVFENGKIEGERFSSDGTIVGENGVLNFIDQFREK